MSIRMVTLGATFLMLVLVVSKTAVFATTTDIEEQTPSSTTLSADVPSISASLVTSGLSRPTDITHAGDNRLFVAEQDGQIRIINTDGTLLNTPFLDIDNLVDSVSHSEMGLLGLTFHPDYPSTPYFYVNYTAEGSGDTVIDRFEVSSNDENVADASSRQEILRVSQPQQNHNAGDLMFGPDGYLYITMGDGGGAGDDDTGHGTVGNGQNKQTLLGKILRIDVDSATPYDIPADNPFVSDTSTLDEIWALGLRNPWRLSFDRESGDLYIADVGQGAREEVNFQPASSSGGENYGWRCYEGFIEFNTGDCGPVSSYTSPIDDYPRSNSQDPNDVGLSITGGFIYRGSDYADLNGYYIYADFVSSNFWLAKQGSPDWEITPIGQLSGVTNPSTFGEGCDGELYVTNYYGGHIYKIQSSENSLNHLTVADGDFLVYLPLILNNFDSCN